MTLEIFVTLAKVEVFLSVLVALMSFIYFKRRNNEAKLIGLTFLVGPLVFLSLGFLELKGKQVNVPQSIHAILYFLGLSVLYHIALRGRYKKFFLGTAILFTTFSVSNLLFWQQMNNNTYSRAVSSIILLGYCVLYFYRLLVDLPVQDLQRVPMFWFNSAILIFNAGNLFLFLFTPYLVEVLNSDMLIYWSFHNILNVVQLLIVSFGLWQDLRNIKSHSSWL